MNIGVMRNFANPNYLTELTAIYAKAYGVNVIYLRPDDVNIKSGFVNGRMLVQNEWINIMTELPGFIDISQFCFKRKNKEIIQYLRENTVLSDNGLNRKNKLKFIEIIKSDKNLSYLAIPTERVESFETIMQFSLIHPKMILKPISGQFGKNIYFVDKVNENKIIIEFGTNTKEFTLEEFIDFYNEFISSKRYIVQKYVQSKTKQGFPFDCRISMEKNIFGKWTVAKRFIRVGVGQKVVANLSQGGIASDLNPFLEANFSEDQIKIIKRDLKRIANTIPMKVESIRKQELMTLGIDIGIDLDGSVYLFEVNGAPGTSQLQATAADLRAQYYSYMKNKILMALE